MIGEGELLLCEDHLLTLWLSEGKLLSQLASQQFAPLAGLSQRQQRRLTGTLRVWLETRGRAADVADRPKLHPQTVRYRMRTIERIFGGNLDDPDARFAMELVLVRRARRPRERGSVASLS